MTTTTRLKHIAGINERALPEDTDPDRRIREPPFTVEAAEEIALRARRRRRHPNPDVDARGRLELRGHATGEVGTPRQVGPPGDPLGCRSEG